MEYNITPERIKELKQYLKDHPIDPEYDDDDGYITLDEDCPPDQLAAQCARELLKMLGELPDGEEQSDNDA